VCSPVGSISIAGFKVPSPCTPESLILNRIERYLRGQVGIVDDLSIIQGTEPEVPVKVSRNRLGRQIEGFWRISAC